MSTLNTTNVKHPSSSTNNIALDAAGKVLLGSTFTGQSTFSPDGGGRMLRVGHGEAGVLLTTDIGTAGISTGSQTAVGSVGFTYFSASNPTELCLTNGTNTVASNIRVYNNGSEVSRWDSGGYFRFNSGYGSVATAYGCRAWVNFDGTSGSIGSGRANGNVSSITDNGTGDYTVNFTTAMPDANYSVVASSGTVANGDPPNIVSLFRVNTTGVLESPTTGYFRITVSGIGGTNKDGYWVCVAVFR